MEREKNRDAQASRFFYDQTKRSGKREMKNENDTSHEIISRIYKGCGHKIPTYNKSRSLYIMSLASQDQDTFLVFVRFHILLVLCLIVATSFFYDVYNPFVKTGYSDGVVLHFPYVLVSASIMAGIWKKSFGGTRSSLYLFFSSTFTEYTFFVIYLATCEHVSAERIAVDMLFGAGTSLMSLGLGLMAIPKGIPVQARFASADSIGNRAPPEAGSRTSLRTMSGALMLGWTKVESRILGEILENIPEENLSQMAKDMDELDGRHPFVVLEIDGYLFRNKRTGERENAGRHRAKRAVRVWMAESPNLSEKNAITELMKIGPELVRDAGGFTEIDITSDAELHSVRTATGPVKLLRVINPQDDTPVWTIVPRDMGTAREAQAWSFGKQTGDYRPDVES